MPKERQKSTSKTKKYFTVGLESDIFMIWKRGGKECVAHTYMEIRNTARPALSSYEYKGLHIAALLLKGGIELIRQ